MTTEPKINIGVLKAILRLRTEANKEKVMEEMDEAYMLGRIKNEIDPVEIEETPVGAAATIIAAALPTGVALAIMELRAKNRSLARELEQIKQRVFHDRDRLELFEGELDALGYERKYECKRWVIVKKPEEMTRAEQDAGHRGGE